jgi:hypothetical protein
MSHKPELSPTTPPLINEGVAYEENDIKTGVLAMSAVAILVLTLAAMAVVLVFMGGVETQRELIAAPTPAMLDARLPRPCPGCNPTLLMALPQKRRCRPR